MKLLVTGGAGFIGSVVTRMLLDAGHRVTVLDDLRTGHRAALAPDATHVDLPVHEAAQVLTPDAGFDGVLHFAALIAAGESMVHPERYWHANTVGSIAPDRRRPGRPGATHGLLLHRRRLRQPGRTAHPGDRRQGPHQHVRGHQARRRLVLTSEATAHGLAAVSLRYFNVAGAYLRDGLAIGERHDPETHLIPIALDVAAGRREKLQLFGDDYPTVDGTCVRDYIHVEDLARAHLLALTAAVPGEHRIYNLGNGSGFTNRQVVDVVREVTGHPLPVEIAPRRDGDPAELVASSALARQELGWVPEKPTLADMVGDAWAFYRTHVLGQS